MIPFEVGERVAFYTNGVRLVGTIKSVDGFKDPTLHVVSKSGSPYAVHPKQCRRLIKKKRREWWINVYADGIISAYESKQQADEREYSGSAINGPLGICYLGPKTECIHVREVREKK